MLYNSKTLTGYKLLAADGEIGKVKDFYFDDRHWTVRYLVADTGRWLSGRKVLLSPYALSEVLKRTQDIAVTLTKKQIEASPSLDSDKPVSRQFEESYQGYYGWPAYWSGSLMWGPYPNMVRDPAMWRESNPYEKVWDPNLRSTHEISGYHIQATDGPIGHVEDFIIDDETWAIRYLVVDTKNWWAGKKVLISPQWIGNVRWNDSTVTLNLSRESIRRSPEYTDETQLSRIYETELYRHYGQQGYWVGELNATAEFKGLAGRDTRKQEDRPALKRTS